ncbi:DUF2156 domain-containing protein [bacterium]|nr:DUF2156 domain-containing protein [bacterium]
MDNPDLTNSIEPLELKHREQLMQSLAPLGHGLSEYCFSNLYLFRKIHDYKILRDKRIFIQGKTYDDSSFLMPAFDLNGVSGTYLKHIIKDFDFFFPIHQTDLHYFDPNVFSFELNRDDSDYIFSTEKLKTYPGRNLSPKRNLAKQFADNTFHSSQPLTKTNKSDAMEVLQDWLTDVSKPVDDTDYDPCHEALKCMDSLGIFGHIYFSKEEPCGFVLAKEVLPKICVFHFAKGKRKFKGVFQFMFSHIANLYEDRFSFYNFEQDLGKPNFRKTKQSYYPDQLLNKYRVRLK